MPVLMHVRPGDLLNLVTQESDNQSWVLAITFLGENAQAVDPQDERSDSILEITRTEQLVTIRTARKVTYKLDPKVSYWHKHVTRGDVVAFKYIARADGRWAISATRHTFGGSFFLRNTHADPTIVTAIVKGRYGPENQRNDWYYYISTNHPKIRYEVDSRWNRDVRFQKVGEPPIWHADKEPAPNSQLAVIGTIGKQPAGPEVIVNVASPVSVSSPVSVTTNLKTSTSLSNSLSSSVNSTNNVTSVNSNANNNSNSNSNQNSNQNQNDNQNQNQNSNDSQSSAQNTNNNKVGLTGKNRGGSR
jgi:hypothetical protein